MVVYQIFLPMVLRWRASRAGAPLINLKKVILLLAREYSFELVLRSLQHNLVNLSAKLLEFHLSPARPQISSFILLNLWKDQVPGYFVKEMLFSTRNAPHAYINFLFIFF